MSSPLLLEPSTASIPDDGRPPSSGPSAWARRHAGSDSRYVVGLVLVLLLALAVRAIPLFAALPYSHYVDEGHVVRATSQVIANTSWDPGFYDYPSGLIGATAVAATVSSFVTGDFGDLRFAAENQNRERFYDPMPTRLLLTARILVLMSSLGIVVLVAHLGRRFAGRAVGLVAALLVAALPALATRSATATVDAPATMFVLASIACALRVRGSPRGLRWAVAAGAFAGFATGTKYTVGLVVLAVAGGIAIDVSTRWTVRLGRLATAGGAAAIAFFLSSPAFFLRNSVVSTRLSGLSQGYSSKTGAGYAERLVTNDEVGWAFVGLTIVGLFFLLRERRSRTETLVVLGFAVPYAWYMTRFSFQPFRNLFPLLGLASVAAAVTVVVGGRTIAEVVGLPHQWSAVVPAGLAVCVAAMLLVSTVDLVHTRAQTVDSRSQVRAWFADLPDCGRVLLPRELGFHPSELDDFGCDEVVVAFAAGRNREEVDLADFDYLVTSSFPHEVADWAQPRWVGRVEGFGRRPITRGNWLDYRSSQQQMSVYTVP